MGTDPLEPGTGSNNLFVRITLVVKEPWSEDYLEDGSFAFQHLTEDLREPLRQLYAEIPGQQSVSIARFA